MPLFAVPAFIFIRSVGHPLMQFIIMILRNHRGASAAEYAMILAIIGGALALAAFALGSTISNSINITSNTIADCGGGC